MTIDPTYRHRPPVTLAVAWHEGDHTAAPFATLDGGIEGALEASASADVVASAVLLDDRGVQLLTWPDVAATDEALDALSELIQDRYPKLIASAERLHLLALEARVVADHERGKL